MLLDAIRLSGVNRLVILSVLLLVSYQNCSPVEFSVNKSKVQAIEPSPPPVPPPPPPPIEPTDCGTHHHLEEWWETLESEIPIPPECPHRVKDVKQQKRCDNGEVFDVGGPVTTVRETGKCACDNRPHGTVDVSLLLEGFSHALECPQKTETCDVQSTRRCDNGAWIGLGSVNINCKTTGTCPIYCGAHADASEWTVHTDDFKSDADPGCTYGGKTRFFDLDITYKCTAGNTSEVKRAETLDRTVGHCNCDGHVHSSIWTITTPNGATGEPSCPGKTLYYDVEQDKICEEGAVSDRGASRKVNPHEVGECNVPCPEQLIWQCGVGTPYAWDDYDLFYSPERYGQYVRVNGPWATTCVVPDPSYFQDYEGIRTQIWSLADDAALTRVNGAVHMDEEATCLIKNTTTDPGVHFGQSYDLQIDWCDNSGCAGSACRITLAYFGRKKGNCR